MDACDADEERVLLGLRTVEGVPLSVLSRLGLSADDGPLSDMLSEGFLQYEGGRIRATREGRPVLDSILKRLLT